MLPPLCPGGDMAKLTPGDAVLIEWVDISEGSNEPTENADLFVWETIGFWVGRARKKGVNCTVIRYSRGQGENGKPDAQSGFLCIPTACVKRVFRLKILDEIKR
jgi:hypothetical protein